MKKLALTTDGKLTYCTATEETIGKGRCNHLVHQEQNEQSEDFLIRVSNFKENQSKIKSSSLYKSFEKFNEKEKERREKILEVLNDEKPKEEITIAVLKAKENLPEEKETYFNSDLVLERLLDIKENGSKEDQEFIDDDIQSFKNSMHSIVEYGMFIMNWDINSKKMQDRSQDTRDFREKLVQMDHARKSKHDAAITSISMMNKICEVYNIEPPFYKGEVEKDSITREEIGNHILQLISNRSEYLSYL